MGEEELHNCPTRVTPSSDSNESANSGAFDFSLNLDEVLRTTCKAAVELLRVDHSGVMIFDSKQQTGRVISEYPSIRTKGLTIQLRGVPAEERLIGLKQPVALPNVSVDPSFRPIGQLLQRHGIQSMLLIPVISNEVTIGSLGLDMINERREFTEDEIKLCQIFAQQAAAVIDLYNRKTAVKRIASVVPAFEDLRKILDNITREAVGVVDGLDGGIAQFNPERGVLTVIADYKFPDLIGTTITLWEGLAGHVIRKDLPFDSVEDYDMYPEQAPVYASTRRFGALLMINLRWQNRTVGVLYINGERGRKFPLELPASLVVLSTTAAVAIVNAHLSHEAETARERIRLLFHPANAIASDLDSERLLKDATKQTLEMADAAWVRLVVFDTEGERSNFLAVRDNVQIDKNDQIRPDGITMSVLRTRKPYVLRDVDKASEKLNEAMIGQGCRAALCLPLDFKSGWRSGVVWIHYTSPRHFSEREIKQLQDFLKQASIAYGHTRQLEELEPLPRVTANLAKATNTKDALQRITTIARELFEANSAVLWPHPDQSSEALLRVREAFTAGIDKTLLDEMSGEVLPVGEVTRFVIREGWLPVSDLEAPRPQLALPETSRRLLRRLKAKSFAGLGLEAAGEKLGVLYLLYRERRDFDKDEARRSRTFATQAALALKRAELLDEATKRHLAAMRAAELTADAALTDLESNLNKIVESVKDTVQCDAVTLFVYSEETNRILPFTTMTGVFDPKLTSHCEDAPRTSIVYEMLTQDEPYVVPRVADNELFRNRPFIERESIVSVCAIPLKVNEHRVGVMFVNYRTPHAFSEAELDQINPLVKQAAAIILSGLRYTEQSRLMSFSLQLLGAKSIDELLELAAQNAIDALAADFLAIGLQDQDGRMRIAEWHGWSKEEVTEYEQLAGEKHQAEFTIEWGPVIVPDYETEKRFVVPQIVFNRDIKCGVSVPMLSGNKPVGAMLAHFRGPRPYLETQSRTLSLIAYLTAIAVQHHQALDSKLALLSAIKRATDEILKIKLGTQQKEVLDEIVKHVVDCFPQAVLGTIQTYDARRNVLRFESVYAKEKSISVESLDGPERLLNRQLGKPIGIAGRSVEMKKPQLVKDVSIDPDYFPFSRETKSELAVPLLRDGDEVVGVLNVESKKENAFTEDDQRALEALAQLVMTTIQNVEQYQALEGSTLLAWFGMESSVWGHIMAQQSYNIRNNIELLYSKLKKYTLEPELKELIDYRLRRIDHAAAQIREEPRIALLHSSEGLSNIDINELIRHRVDQLRRNSPYKEVNFNLRLSEKSPFVRCNPDWVKRMLDILIDNGIDAMSAKSSRTLSISTKFIEECQVEITITDNGTGIPSDIQDKLFKQRIEKDNVSKGLGLGLLMVQAIVQMYRGRVGIEQTGPAGTTLYVRLPVIPNQPLS